MTQEDRYTPKKIPVILMIIFDVLTMGIYSCSWFILRRPELNKLTKTKQLNLPPFIICLLLSVTGIILIFVGAVVLGIGEATGDLSYHVLSEKIDLVDKLLEFAVGITLLVQSFKIKSMMEKYLETKDRFGPGLSGVATFFFRQYYLQYRINKIYKEAQNQDVEPVQEMIAEPT